MDVVVPIVVTLIWIVINHSEIMFYKLYHPLIAYFPNIKLVLKNLNEIGDINAVIGENI